MEIWQNTQLEDLPGETWKPVLNYEDSYQVSNMGRIKAIPRKTRTWEIKYTKILKLKIINGGYVQTKFSKNGKIYSPIVSKVVAEAFCKKPSYKCVANHINCVRHDNKASNLEWISQSQNVRFSYKIGKASQKGEKNNGAKINMEIVKKIRKFAKENDHLSQQQIANEFGLKRENVKDIINYKTWNY